MIPENVDPVVVSEQDVHPPEEPGSLRRYVHVCTPLCPRHPNFDVRAHWDKMLYYIRFMAKLGEERRQKTLDGEHPGG